MYAYRRHYKSEKFRIGNARWSQRETLQHCFEASRVYIWVNAEPLEPGDAFPYLGRTVVYNNSDWEAMHHNLWKDR